jgi:hypothetical protein
MLQQQGTLILRPIQAQLNKDKDKFGKMDPYVQFRIGDIKEKSSKCKNGGLTPQWQDVIQLQKPIGEDVLIIELFDDDLFGDDRLATAQVQLSQFLQQQMQSSQYVTLFSNNQQVGNLLLQVQFQPIGLTGIGQVGQQQQQYLPQQQQSYQKHVDQTGIYGPGQQPIGGYQQSGYQQQTGLSQPLSGYQQPGVQQTGFLQGSSQPLSGYPQTGVQQPSFQQGSTQQQQRYPQQGQSYQQGSQFYQQ